MRSCALAFVAACTLLAAAAALSTPLASAHEGADHEHEMPPAAVVGGGGANAAAAAPANDQNAPAPGAQPAAPGDANEIPNVADPDAQVDDANDDAGKDDVVIAPIDDDTDAVPEVELSTTLVDGGGTGGGGGGGGGGPATAGPATATPSGDLPFTGAAENLLLIVLAGMLAPIGVLLYCGAQRGDEQRARRNLASPRFQWAGSPGHRAASFRENG